MKRNSFLRFAAIAGTLWLPFQAHGQTQLAVPNSPAYEQAAAQLRVAPPRGYDFSKAMMADVMRLMAEDAGISFFGLPEGATGAERLVTFSINASPFTALETLAKANGISLIFESGIWYIRPADDSELVGRIYEIAYNAQEMVKKNDQTGSMGGNGGGSGAGGNAGTSSIGLNLQGAPNFFVTEPSRLLDDIRAILDLPTTGRNATFAPTGSVETLGQLSLGGLQAQPDVFVRTGGQNGAGGASPDGSDSANLAKVIWNSDSNSLYVVATRQQHQWIEGYLAAADQPQPLVSVEVKFLEINKDPQSELGIDWTGTLSGGWGASLEGVDGSISSPVNLDRVGDYTLPTAILSYDDVNLRLRALFSDRKNRTVSYPRMITLDNREVSFRSVINQPVLSSSASTSLGAGATETNSIEYVPIGTVINILPKRMNDGKVLLNVSITVSDIIGTEIINGNPFPIASSRVYTAPITVDSGYTVAISGLDAAQDDRQDQGVPVLGRIPVLGNAFKYRSNSRSRQHLMMLITPTLLNPKDPGVRERPTIRNPWGSDLPAFDAFGDDRLPPEELDRDERRERKKEDRARETAPRPLPPYQAMNPVPAPASPVPVATHAPLAAAEPVPAWETPAPAAAREKSGLFARIFNSDKSRDPIKTGPVDGEVPEITPLQTVTPAAPPVEGGASHPPQRFAEVEPLPIPAPESVAAPQVAAAEAKGLRWDGNRLAGGTSAVPDAVNYLEGELRSAQSGNSAEKVVQVRNETNRLLQYVNQLREDGTIPMNGPLSDEWWTLIKLKTQANAISRNAAPVMVDSATED